MTMSTESLSYALKLADQADTHGPYTASEIRERLEQYRGTHPEDDAFSKVSVWEMRPGGTAGRECSVFEFIEE